MDHAHKNSVRLIGLLFLLYWLVIFSACFPPLLFVTIPLAAVATRRFTAGQRVLKAQRIRATHERDYRRVVREAKTWGSS